MIVTITTCTNYNSVVLTWHDSNIIFISKSSTTTSLTGITSAAAASATNAYYAY
jgi:hypothetical protein